MTAPERRPPRFSASDLLREGRDARPLRYDTNLGLSRHRALAHSLTSLPDWATQMTTGKVGLTLAGKGLVVAAVTAATGAAMWAHSTSRSVAPSALAAPSAIVTSLAASSSAATPSSAMSLDALPRADRANERSERRTARHRVAASASSSRLALTEQPEPPGAAAPSSELPASAPHAEDAPREDGTKKEVEIIAEAERLLGANPGRALSLVRSLSSSARSEFLAQEREYVTVMALLSIADTPSARDQARRFLQLYPRGPYTERVRAKLDLNR